MRKGAILERFFTIGFDPIYFDRGKDGRLNAPDGSYGVLYAAGQVRGAFAETFLRTTGRRTIAMDLVKKKARIQLRATRELTLIKLSGAGLARIGATAEITHGGLPFDAPQAWSKAIHDLAFAPDGIAYTARHDDEALCYALFDHTPVYVKEESRETDIDQDWFWQAAKLYDVGLRSY